MTNSKRGQVSIELGGRKRVLKLTLNDFAQLQDMNEGKPLLEILADLDKMDIKLIRSILCLALRHEDKDLTEEQVGSFDADLSDVLVSLSDCISKSLGGGEKPKGKK